MINLINIHKEYKTRDVKTIALKNFSLAIKQGEFFAVMGPSGSGKTTLLNILGLMDTFDKGQYLFHYESINKFNQSQLAKFRNKYIGFVFQSYHLIDDLTVFENVELPLGLAGVQKDERKKRVLEIIDRVGLREKVDRYPKQLSGGQQQRVAIARAIVNYPHIILADEPTGNLDSQNGKEIMDLLCTLNEQGITIVLVTHDNAISEYAKKIIYIKDGEMV